MRPEPQTLLVYDLGHASAAVAGQLGALLVLIAATGMRWYRGIPLAALGLALEYWNAAAAFGSHVW